MENERESGEAKFAITDDRSAEWALRKIREIYAERDRLVELCNLEIEAYNEKIEAFDKKADSDATYLKLLLADLLQESFDGCQGGAHGRIYPDNALDYAKCGTTFLCRLYAGTGADAVSAANYEALICSFRPDPAVAAIAAWEPERMSGES